MRRFFAVLAGLAVVAMFAAGAASAACTTTTFHLTFAEPFGGPNGGGGPAANCPQPFFRCGHGAVNGIQVFTGVQSGPEGEDFVLRTLFFSDGSTVTLEESWSAFTSPGNSGITPACCAYGHPLEVPLQEEIVGGTGAFEGITGTVTGTMSIAGGVALIRLSGTVTYGC